MLACVCAELVSETQRKRQGETHLHAQVRVAHAAVDGQDGEGLAAVLFHGVENGLCLEAGRLQRRSSEVAALGVSGDAKDCSFGVVDPVGRKEAAEGGDEDTAAVVIDRRRQVGNFVRLLGHAEVVD